MVAVLAPATGRLADPHEVGRLEAGAVMRGADEGLHQPRTILVAGFEILRHTRQHLAQHLAGQVAALHAGADQEPAQAQHPVQMGLALLSAPSHPRLARPQLQRRGRKPDRAQHPVRRDHQIAHLAARKGRRPLRMLEVQQGIPHPPLPALLYHLQRQPRDRLHRTRHRRGRRHRRVETLRHRRAPATPRRRQRNPPRLVQRVERLETTRELGRPARIHKPELRAHPPPHRRPVVQRLLRHNPLEASLRLRRTKGSVVSGSDAPCRDATRRKLICPALNAGTRQR